MKIAYLIAVHKMPTQLGRLISSLMSENVHFFVHVDKGSNFEGFRDILSKFPPKTVTYVKREHSKWGSFGIVLAILNGLKTIIESGIDYDFVILLSGQDYPIKSNKYIREYLQNNKTKSFISSQQFPIKNWPYDGFDRIQRYHFYIGNHLLTVPPYTRAKSLKRKLFNYMAGLYFNRPRVHPFGLTPYGGALWF